MKPLPNINLLRELLTYSPESGELRWKVKPSVGVNAGDIAGTHNNRGYIQVSIKRKLYLAHRIAWALHYGIDPYPHIVDHKEGVEEGNGINNLRVASWGQNVANVARRANNTSGHRGVTYHKKKKKWVAQIDVNGKRIYLGAYKCKEEAINARLKAEADNNIYVRAS